MATPALPINPFPATSLTERTTATGMGLAPRPPAVVMGVPGMAQTTNALRQSSSIIPQQRRVVAGVSPESQMRYNQRRLLRGQGIIIPQQFDPMQVGAHFLMR